MSTASPSAAATTQRQTATGPAITAPTLYELRPAAQMRSVGWFMRRAALGLFALTIFVSGGAWLLHASIEPDVSIAQQIDKP